MDFQELMKQASANQHSAQRRHDQKKRQMEDKKKKEEEEKREDARKASAVLQHMKKTSEKKQLEYRGIVNSRAADDPFSEFEKAVRTKASPTVPSVASSSHRKANFDRTSNTKQHSAVTTSTKQAVAASASSSKSSSETKRKAKSPISTDSALQNSSKSSGSKSSHPKTMASSKQPTSTTKVHTSSTSNRLQKPPVNFQDLMKLAGQKSTSNMPSLSDLTTTGRNGLKTTTEKPARREREGSPLGKQLLERSYCRLKQRRTEDGNSKSFSGENGCGSRAMSSRGECSTSSRSTQGAVTDGSSVRSNLRELAQSRVVKPGSSGRGGRTGQVAGVSLSSSREQKLPESALLIRERFRKELEASVKTKPPNGSRGGLQSSVKSNSFYGSSHAQLSKEGRPRFPSKRNSSGAEPFQNSWVREMTGYMEQVREEDECYSDEEYDDLDDFVVDDEEGDDVSSAIKEIFGYDKSRFRDEDYDDRLMESSFAQQQYEEMRSSRIGRLEDAEDMKKEAERHSRKKRKGPASSMGPRGLKQSKLSF